MVRSINDVVAMVEAVCRLPSNVPALRRLDAGIKFPEFKRAVADHDSAFLYGWLMEIFSLQGISDANAFSYIETHGNAEWKQVKKLLAKGPQACAKLKTFADFKNCGFRKTAGTCNVPELLEACAVPQLPLRKGDLNQLAFSLFLFIRDVCKGDLIGFIDTTIAEAKASETDDPERAARHALIKAFKPIFGVGTKLIAMSLASILIAGGRARPDWVKLGRSMIVVDSLVHNFLHRSGILAAYRKSHAYGPACYGKKGCEIVLRDIASKIDLKTIDPRLPSHHPRMVQSAIWRLCAEWGLDLCNGCQIDDTKRCGLTDCPVRSLCSRRVLFPKKPEAALVVPPPDDGPMIEAGSQGESNTLAPEDEGTSPKGFRGRGRSTIPIAKRPRLQGDGDGLCGLYTIINGLRLACEGQGGLSTYAEEEIWKSLVRYADRQWRFASLYLNGLSTGQLLALAAKAAEKASRITGKELAFQPILKADLDGCTKTLEAVVARLVALDRRAIVAGMESDEFSHWSIIRGLSSKSAWLLDSDGSHRVLLKNCALVTRPKAKLSPRYWVKLYGTFGLKRPVARPQLPPLAINGMPAPMEEQRMTMEVSREQ